MNIAIIPARGGSKRIPKKNIKDFLGKPIIFYSIDACLEANIFDKIIVSSDSKEILGIVKNQYDNKVETLERSEINSTDDASTVDVLKEVFDYYDNLIEEIDITCCIYPCAPFIKPKWLKDSINMFYENYDGKEYPIDSIISVCEYPVPIEWALSYNKYLNTVFHKSLLNIKSQDCKKYYHDAGMFYFINNKALLYEEDTLFGNSSVPFIINKKECQDIDTIEDWEYAELKYKVLKEIEK